MASYLYTTASITTLFLILLSFALPSLSGPVFISSIAPNFTASFLQFVDNSGAFLASRNGSFQARITNPMPESQSYYFAIVHVSSNTIIWSANRNTPISKSSELRFSPDGLTLYNDTGHPVWSTPPRNKPSSVSRLQLLESGNLIMFDGLNNNTVWQSFDSPTDVIVMAQELRVGKSLISSVSEDDLSEGSYSFVIGENDAILQWNAMTYWKLSMDTKAFRDTNFRVKYLVMNFTAMYLMGSNGTAAVIRVILNDSNSVTDDSSNFQFLKLDPNGIFNILKLNSRDRSQIREFTGPVDKCRVPSICSKLSVCTNGGSCQCAPGFHIDPRTRNGDCAPSDISLLLPLPCDGASDGAVIKYMNLRDNLDYFSIDFTDPVLRDVNLSVCQTLCSQNCSCLGIFYSQDSRSCYTIQNYLGSIMVKSSPAKDEDHVGYIKTIVVENERNDDSENKKSNFPVLAMVLLPSLGVLLTAMVPVLIWLRRRRTRRKWSRNVNKKLGRTNSTSSVEGEFEFASIPGLPVRLNYNDLVVATEDFKTRIGSGGFGTVYKGTLRDGVEVAVKKFSCLGAQGEREFLTEIGIIGKIHHVNLVKLRGFCTHRGQKFLVYEYMNRGSLDRTLFHGDGPVLEWRQRYEIALGTARGLAYLHTGCEHKILHCDVKPENILLHDNLLVKLSDFGLSKLLSPDESGLFTTLRGTRGYLAPEWLTSSVISDRTDVYSYGMVLLELLRGKKNSSAQTPSNNSSGTNINTRNNNNNNQSSSLSAESGHRPIYFPLFALEMHEEGRYMELVDPRLGGRVRSEQVEKLVRIALCCVHEEPLLRPSMSNVVGMLEGILPLAEPRIESLNFLRFYGRRFTEASRLEENNGENEFAVCRQQVNNSSTTRSYNSFSYISSHQLSGPR